MQEDTTAKLPQDESFAIADFGEMADLSDEEIVHHNALRGQENRIDVARVVEAEEEHEADEDDESERVEHQGGAYHEVLVLPLLHTDMPWSLASVRMAFVARWWIMHKRQHDEQWPQQRWMRRASEAAVALKDYTDGIGGFGESNAQQQECFTLAFSLHT